jgi:hypothetical protein
VIEQKERMEVPEEVLYVQAFPKTFKEEIANARDHLSNFHLGLLADFVDGLNWDLFNSAESDVELYKDIVGAAVRFVNVIEPDSIESIKADRCIAGLGV